MDRIAFRLVIAGVALVLAAVAYGQDEGQPPRSSYTSMLNVDAMIDNYARLVARKYSLTPEQDAYTQQLIREKSQAFLAEYRDQLFPIVDRLFEVRAGGEISTSEMMQWGRIAAPIFEKAKVIIVDANNEWRQILDDNQKKIHDADVQLMWQNFGTAEDQLARMKRGEMTIEEFRQGKPPPAAVVPGGPQPNGAKPATPRAGPTGEKAAGDPAAEARARLEELRRGRQGGEPPHERPTTSGPSSPRGAGKTPGMAGTDFESKWEQYVRDFIQKHQLDEGQTQRANSILKDCLDQGRSYMARKKSDVEELDKKIQDAQGKPERASDLKQFNEQRSKLLEPLERIFETRLKPRLDRIPTTAQREAAGTATPPAGAKPAAPATQPKPSTQPKP
jgi:hypothetical protein